MSRNSHGPEDLNSGHLSDGDLAEVANIFRKSQEPGPTRGPELEDERTSHLALCPECREAVENTTRAIEALQSPIQIHHPPKALWDRIAHDLSAEGTSGNPPQPEQGRPTTRWRRGTVPGWSVFAAAAAGLIIGGAAVAGILGQEPAEDETTVTAEPVAETSLEPVDDEHISGRAEMVPMADGSMALNISIEGATDPAEGYFEVWLRDEDASRLISLGAVTAESVTLRVPSGIDLTQYPVVDVSHEHFDGDPGHSGITLAAGPLQFREE